jgi:hypothetical protein
MFAGLFGSDLFVRLTDADREPLLEEGGADFAPMPGRGMKGHVVLPAGWADRPVEARDWIERTLHHTLTMPAKAAKKKGSPR